MNSIRHALLAGALMAAAALAWADVPDAAVASTAAERHTAECVAALKTHSEDLAAQVRSGNDGLRGMLRTRLEEGAAFLGTAYLDGERDEAHAHAQLEAALEAQKALTPRALAARQASCAREGDQMLARANFVSRAVVSRVARNRMNKLLEVQAKAP